MSDYTCEHPSLIVEPSRYAERVGYQRFTCQQRVAATTPSSRTRKTDCEDATQATIFPGPLVLPDDDLALDPKYPHQSLRQWIQAKERNKITSQKSIIYIAQPPDIDPTAEFLHSWSFPQKMGAQDTLVTPRVDQVKDYVAAFYHGMQVKLLSSLRLSFTSWEDESSNNRKANSKALPKYIGLTTSTESVRIRVRPSPDGLFYAQLNLDDLLDAAIDLLPEDAYALLILLDHDLYEDEEDTFICGRAYGGSRVATVSVARYNPLFDLIQNVEREHAWPASHCEAYVESVLAKREVRPKKKPKKAQREESKPKLASISTVPNAQASPILAALNAHKAVGFPITSPATLSGLWLGRVCRTASHEIGHCFGIDHCVYYACSMQGSASISEDARQPPYLCPVDLAKMLHATGSTTDERYKSLLKFCEQHADIHLFEAFGQWIRGRLPEVVAL